MNCPRCGFTDIPRWQMSSDGEASGFVCDFCGHRWSDGCPDVARDRAIVMCPDCAVAINEKHALGCDVARCLFTGYQRLSCFDDHECGEDIWTGQWPGDEDVTRLGLSSLNDLHEGRVHWDRDARRWETA